MSELCALISISTLYDIYFRCACFVRWDQESGHVVRGKACREHREEL